VPLAIVLLVVGVILILVELLTTVALAWLLWLGIALALLGLVLLVLDRSGRPLGRRRSNL
jgi:membrane-bound ClpP family serine protease